MFLKKIYISLMEVNQDCIDANTNIWISIILTILLCITMYKYLSNKTIMVENFKNHTIEY